MVTVQDGESIAESEPSPDGSVRIATLSGGGARENVRYLASTHAVVRGAYCDSGLLPAGKDYTCSAIAPLQLHFRTVA